MAASFAKTPDLDREETISSFRDYWVAVPGGKGRKLDWDATFRNWVRNQRPGKSTSPDSSWLKEVAR